MMKNLQTLVIILAALFFTACEKDEIPETFDSISGILTAGENVYTEDLEGIKIYLGRFHDSVDFQSITFETTAIDSVTTTTLASDGSFSFNGMPAGNYGLALEDGFIFTSDTALTVQLNGLNQPYINQSIDRIAENKGATLTSSSQNKNGTDTFELTIENQSTSIFYQLKKLNYYTNSKLQQSYKVPQTESPLCNSATYKFQVASHNNQEVPNLEFELILWKYSRAGKVSDTHTTTRIPAYKCTNNKTASCTWTGSPFDISWVTASKTGYWYWKLEKPGHYILSKHN